MWEVRLAYISYPPCCRRTLVIILNALWRPSASPCWLLTTASADLTGRPSSLTAHLRSDGENKTLLAHTHTHTHSHTHIHTHTNTLARTHSHSLTHAHAHTHTNPYTHVRTNTCGLPGYKEVVLKTKNSSSFSGWSALLLINHNDRC